MHMKFDNSSLNLTTFFCASENETNALIAFWMSNLMNYFRQQLQCNKHSQFFKSVKSLGQQVNTDGQLPIW